jgi:replication initiation and membrane attachment protein DnaB
MQNLLESINNAILASYGSYTNPNYFFVSKVFKRKPYEKVIEELRLRFKVEDITDINYDVSFVYTLSNEETYGLNLSMVGRFFALFQLASDRKQRHVVGEPSSPDVDALVQTLEKHGFIKIDESTMNLLTCLEDGDPGNNSVFEALFERS